MGIFVGPRRKEMCHSFAPVVSCHPVMMGRCCGSYITTVCFVEKKCNQHYIILPIPIKVCFKEVITCPVQGKLDRRLGSANVTVPTERGTYPVAVPTCTLGAAALKFWIGASLAK